MTVTVRNLSATISEVIEELALVVVEEPETRPEFSPDTVAWIEVTGSITGQIIVRCRRELGILLASNLLGIDPEDAQAQEKASDAIGEMLNVICGNLITNFFGAEKTFNVSIPRVADIESAPENNTNWAMQETFFFLFDSHPIEFVLNVSPALSAQCSRKECHGR